MTAKMMDDRRDCLQREVAYDRIIEEYHDDEMSEFVTVTAGDVTVYRVYGKLPEKLKIVCK